MPLVRKQGADDFLFWHRKAAKGEPMHTQKILHRQDVPEYREGQDDIVTWDRKGLAVRWKDGHRTYLPWDALRSLCQCRECRAEGVHIRILANSQQSIE